MGQGAPSPAVGKVLAEKPTGETEGVSGGLDRPGGAMTMTG